MKHFIVLLVAAISAYAHPADVDYFGWDGRIVYEASSIKSEGLKGVSKCMSDAAQYVYVGVPSALYTYGVVASALDQPTADRRYASETGIQALTSLGITYGIAVATKIIVDRERPYLAYPGLIANGEGPENDKYLSSFPSGHSAGAAAIATTMMLRYPKWYVIAPSVGYALWMGFSRLNLGVHYLTDVLAGYAIGAGVAYGVHVVSKELFNVAEPILPAGVGLAVGMAGTPTTPLFTISMNF
ncbi:MAG: phosphatase PAP2 family protein [Ignavibacteria bacterium]|nr:phosphatase PAP2 family protein [Ignavibacteria bacterium]